MKKLWVMLLMAAVMLIPACSIPNRQVESAAGSNSHYGIKDIKVDKGYLLAVDTIDGFLNAWRIRDPKQGMELLTDSAKKTVSSENLIMFFTGLSNPHHQGFELIGAERPNQDTVRFYVWLYEYYTGESPESADRPDPYYVDVVKVNEDKWLVNNFPMEIK